MRKEFEEFGFLVLPELLPDAMCERLTQEADHWVDDGLRARSIASSVSPRPGERPPLMELELPAHGELLVHEGLLHVVAVLMDAPFVFHHLHSDRHEPGIPGKAWHHDYEPNDQGDEDLLMVHALHYPGGLNGTVGGLAVLPGSHREGVSKPKAGLAHLGTAELPGEVVLDTLPPGTTVLIHSALLHARRPTTTHTATPRYFIDASYCQVGARWRPVKPYWRHMLATARAARLGGDQWPELFAERHFTEYVPSC